ncbi:CAP domain-containing protein [Halobaculum sp. D14]|uniref:CAP domain-containing protein n=1 Tax=Halobaculum sp. D14 TaxID=3421642 RepID=UPI003EBBFF86
MGNQEKGQHCPSCGGRVWRLSGDKFLKCHRCGWTVGYPVLRWVLHPTWILYYLHRLRKYPVSSLWSLAKIGTILLIGGLLITGAIPTSDVLSGVDSASSGGSNGPPEDAIVQEGYNLNRTETLFIQYLNRERSSRGLQNVSKWSVLTEMGRAHSRDMAEKGYFAHKEPDGDTIKDRYNQRGLLPKCRLPISGTDRYYAGAENIAKTHINTQVRAEWADGGTYSVYGEQDLARAIFQMWMHSPEHRKAMLVASADQAGLGLYITENGTVYASLELC